jgi:hypothetical protein
VEIEQVEVTKLLGLTLDCKLSWSKHIDTTVAKLGRRLSIIKCCSSFLTACHDSPVRIQVTVGQHPLYSTLSVPPREGWRYGAGQFYDAIKYSVGTVSPWPCRIEGKEPFWYMEIPPAKTTTFKVGHWNNISNVNNVGNGQEGLKEQSCQISCCFVISLRTV